MAAQARRTPFFVVKGAGGETRVLVWDTRRIRAGRSSDCDLVLEDPELSRRHALFTREGDACSVENLSETNGTFVNGERITRHRLAGGDLVAIGELELVFHTGNRSPLAVGLPVEFASQLGGFRIGGAGEGPDATVLGLSDSPLEVPGSEVPTEPVPAPADLELAADGSLGRAAAPRDLDAELDDVHFASTPQPLLPTPAPAEAPPTAERKRPEDVCLRLRVRCRGEDLRTAVLALVGRSLVLPGVRVDVELGEDD